MDLDDSELYWTRKQKGLVTEEETERYIRSLEKKIKELEENYIPKSKVREKIKKLEKHIAFYEKNESYKERIIELKEDLQMQENYTKDLQKKLTNSVEIKYIHQDYIPKSLVKEKIEELNDKMAEQVYIIKEFGEHKGNREKLTMYKDYRDAYAELLQERR